MVVYNKKLTEINFHQEVLKSDLPVLVEFGADWCGTCHILAPILEELNEEFSGRVKIGKVDVDENKGVQDKYGIMELPTLLFFKAGQVVDHIIGAVPRTEIEGRLNKILSG